jgi:hypothetical protein
MGGRVAGRARPFENPPRVSGMQAYISYLPGLIFSAVELPLSPILRTRVNAAV